MFVEVFYISFYSMKKHFDKPKWYALMQLFLWQGKIIV